MESEKAFTLVVFVVRSPLPRSPAPPLTTECATSRAALASAISTPSTRTSGARDAAMLNS